MTITARHVWWCTPEIPAFWRVRRGSRPSQLHENVSQKQKKKKNRRERRNEKKMEGKKKLYPSKSWELRLYLFAAANVSCKSNPKLKFCPWLSSTHHSSGYLGTSILADRVLTWAVPSPEGCAVWFILFLFQGKKQRAGEINHSPRTF